MSRNRKVRETALWNWIKPMKGLIGAHIQRVESRDTADGTPDVEGCYNTVPFQLELKTCARPSRDTTKLTVKIRPSQVAWAVDRVNAGGKSFALIQVGAQHGAKRYLIDGLWLGVLMEERKTEAELSDIGTYVQRPQDLLEAIWTQST